MRNPAIPMSIFGSSGAPTLSLINGAPASLKLAQSFFAADSYLSHFWIALRSYGTPANVNLKIELFADSGGTAPIPTGAALATHTVSGTPETGAAAYYTKIVPDWSAIELTIGSRYWIVATNESAAPTVDYAAISCRPDNFWSHYADSYNQAAAYENAVRKFNGTDWTTVAATSGSGFWLVYTSGAKNGAMGSTTPGSYVADFVTSNASTEIGWEITIPCGLSWNIVGALMTSGACRRGVVCIYQNRVKVYESPDTQQDVAAVIDNLEVVADLVFNPGDKIAVMLKNPGNYSNMGVQFHQIPNDADFTDMQPYAPRLVKNVGGVWTESAVRGMPIITFLLDSKRPFIESINRRKFYMAR